MVKIFYIENKRKGNILNIVDTWKDGEVVKGTLGYNPDSGFFVESQRGRMTLQVILPKNFSEEAQAWLHSCISQEFKVECISFEESNFNLEKI